MAVEVEMVQNNHEKEIMMKGAIEIVLTKSKYYLTKQGAEFLTQERLKHFLSQSQQMMMSIGLRGILIHLFIFNSI